MELTKKQASEILTAVFPKHLWVSNDKIYHMDEIDFRRIYQKVFQNARYVIDLYSIAIFSTSSILLKEIGDSIGILLHDRSYNYIEMKSAFRFLKEVGGNYTEYAEMIVLATGVNVLTDIQR